MENFDNIVMLPNDTSLDRNHAPIFKDSMGGKLVENPQPTNIEWKDCEYYHLHVTSDEKLKDGDYCIEEIGGVVFGPYKEGDTVKNPKKIVETTDKNLTKAIESEIGARDYFFPIDRPSDILITAYVKAYNEGKIK